MTASCRSHLRLGKRRGSAALGFEAQYEVSGGNGGCATKGVIIDTVTASAVSFYKAPFAAASSCSSFFRLRVHDDNQVDVRGKQWTLAQKQ